jgi:D-alanyl-D-alanine carboxypeptidase (penicillin-binding protein 5/6)
VGDCARAWRAGLGAVLLASGSAYAAAAASAWLPDGTKAPAAYVVASEDRVLASHAPRALRQPASLAKLAGALVMLDAERERPGLLNQTAIVSARAASTDGTRLGLRKEERVAVSALLAAMLVGSANDACLTLAEHLAGSAERFVRLMNARARALGMKDTRFVDPCGFDRAGQHTTAADMLRLGRAALADPTILRIVEQPFVRVVVDDGARVLSARNTNALLGRYDGAFGVKTGHTREAGPCLIAAARRGTAVVLVVVLGSRDRWPVTVALFDEAFDRLTGYPRVRGRATIGEPDF